MEVLYLHYAEGRTPSDAVKHDFWQEEYLISAQDLLNDLISKSVLYEDTDLSKSLNEKKVSELKELLRENSLKVSGNKPDLIQRIVSNSQSISFSNFYLETILQVAEEYKELYRETKFITYAHRNYYIDIFEIYNYYLSSPGKSQHEIILETMKEKYKLRLNEPNKHDAKMLADRISDYYLIELNDVQSGYYYLNCSVMIQVMQNVESYRGMLAFYGKAELESGNIDYLFNIYEKSYKRYKNMFYTKLVRSADLAKDIYEDTQHLPYSKTDMKLVADFVFHYFVDPHAAGETLKYEIERRYFSRRKPKNRDKVDAKEIDSVESGFKRFIKNIFK